MSHDLTVHYTPEGEGGAGVGTVSPLKVKIKSIVKSDQVTEWNEEDKTAYQLISLVIAR